MLSSAKKWWWKSVMFPRELFTFLCEHIYIPVRQNKAGVAWQRVNSKHGRESDPLNKAQAIGDGGRATRFLITYGYHSNYAAHGCTHLNLALMTDTKLREVLPCLWIIGRLISLCTLSLQLRFSNISCRNSLICLILLKTFLFQPDT